MIELKGVSAGYGKQAVLDDVTVSFEKGRLTSVIGVNGSGKSTLLKTMIAILPRSSGEMLIDGVNADSLSRQQTARKIAYLPQGKSVPDMTVEQIVLHGRFPHLRYPRRYGEKDRAIAQSAMEQMGISALKDRSLPALSGGMRQKAYIAMALAQDAEYILLDEPTTYLDIAGQLELMTTLRSLADNQKSIVTVMHDLPMAFTFSDRIVVIHNGAICASGTPRELCNLPIIQEVFGVRLTQDPQTGFGISLRLSQDRRI